MLRRLVALALMLCFGLFTAEALLADVHDGDATHEELVRVDGERHVDQHAATAAGVEHAPGERIPGKSGHAQHACHCTHAHGAWSPVVSEIAAASTVVMDAPPSRDFGAPATPAREPQLRPPIA